MLYNPVSWRSKGTTKNVRHSQDLRLSLQLRSSKSWPIVSQLLARGRSFSKDGLKCACYIRGPLPWNQLPYGIMAWSTVKNAKIFDATISNNIGQEFAPGLGHLYVPSSPMHWSRFVSLVLFTRLQNVFDNNTCTRTLTTSRGEVLCTSDSQMV